LSQRDRGKKNSTDEMKGKNLMTEKNITREGKHLDSLSTNFDEELEFLEDLAKPKVEEGHTRK
jgi:hypothetical protein